jgi:phosphohistidine swiveling domain-containing protein/DNA-binding transcriptional ArsR family regulator
MRISVSSKKILQVIFAGSQDTFHVNELIRRTGLYPNAVHQALKTLEKQGVVKYSRKGRLKLYSLNNSYQHLEEVRKIVSGQHSTYQGSRGKGYDWVKILNRQTSYSFTKALCTANVVNLKKRYSCSVPTFWHNSITYGVYYLKEELARLGRLVSEKIEADLRFARRDVDDCLRVCDKLVEVSKKIPTIDLPGKSEKELIKLLEDFYLHYLEVFPFVTVPHAIERYFEEKIRKEVEDEKALKVLLSPITTQDEERDSAFIIAAYGKSKGIDKKFHSLISEHWERFCWFPMWSIHAEPLTIEYFEDEVKNIMDTVKDPKGELRRLREEEKRGERQLLDTFKKINATPQLKEEVRLLQQYIHLRMYRKNAICQAHYYHLPLLYEAGSRLEFDSEDVRLLSHEEILKGLRKQLSKRVLKNLIESRKRGWAILMREGKVKTITGVKEIIEAMERFQIVAPTSAMQRVVKGSVACRGRVTGRVKVVTKLAELTKVEEGDILVAKMTTPDYVAAMHKSAAFVTDEGGITCHAAIVAREFNVPCIIGTRNATQILADNDLVEVDAIEGVVRVVEAVEAPEDIRVIAGRMIHKGRVKGTARVVLDASDFAKVESGDILITAQTTPEYLSVLYRVKGFVVDEDSLTSHASLYGKALKLPSIMGTSFARSVVEDGEMIELDASRGVVTLLNRS